MRISVIVEPVNGMGFRAQNSEFGISVEGETREGVIEQVRHLVKGRLATGATVESIEVAPEEHPLMKFYGTLKDDEITREWMEIMAERRRQIDQDESLP